MLTCVGYSPTTTSHHPKDNEFVPNDSAQIRPRTVKPLSPQFPSRQYNIPPCHARPYSDRTQQKNLISVDVWQAARPTREHQKAQSIATHSALK